MTVIHGNQKNHQGMLDVLEKYIFIYDEKSQRKNDIATAYNNRCYAKMQLKDLKGALDDCTRSLRFGNLPDAYSKQQKLVEMLKGTTGNT